MDPIEGRPGGDAMGAGPGLPDLGQPDLVVHQTYRRVDLHRRFGGQSQGGISTPAGRPLILLFSSPEGESYGYRDGWEEGLYNYAGEGQVGDMRLIRGNAAIHGHSEDGKDLLLFMGAGRGRAEFAGRMVAVGSRWAEGPDREGNRRRIIIFQLAPAEGFAEGVGPIDSAGEGPADPLGGLSMAELRARAAEDPRSGNSGGTPADRVRRVWYRSEAVRRYALGRSMGICEGCLLDAPFVRADGSPFLEVHHLRRRSDGGPDRPEAVAAVCPNCHRRAHHSAESEAFNRELVRRVREREAELGYAAD